MAMQTKAKNWMLEELRKSFHNTPNADLADLFGCSCTSVRRWARRLGLSKDPDYLQQIVKRMIVCSQVSTKHRRKPPRRNRYTFVKGHHMTPTKAVIRMDTLQIYSSITEGAKAVGSCLQNISRSCRKGGRCMGAKWMYLDSYNRLQERIRNKPKWQLTAEERRMLNK